MKNPHGFAFLPILLAILGVLAVSGGAYAYLHRQDLKECLAPVPNLDCAPGYHPVSDGVNAFGCRVSKCEKQTTTPIPLTATRSSGPAPLSLWFMASAPRDNRVYTVDTGDGKVLTMVWDNGSGLPGGWSLGVSYTYSAKGVYTATLYADGEKRSTLTVTVTTTDETANNPVAPIISSVSASSVSIDNYYFSITASNLDPLGAYVGSGWVSRSHVFVWLTDSAGQKGILWEGGSQGGNTVNGNQITMLTVPVRICKISTVATGGCPTDKYMNIVPGDYSLSISVDGRGISNSVPLAVTPHVSSGMGGGR